MSKRTEKHGSYLSNNSVHELNEVHGWFVYEDAQSDVSQAFANNAVHSFIEAAKEAEMVKQETGLTPRQLLQQRAELLEALKKCRFDSLNMSIDTWREIQETIQRIDQ